MAFPLASGTIYPAGSSQPSPAYSGTFIPELWSGKILEKFYDSTVLAAIANTDWEGEIKKFGDKVHIRTKPTLTIRPYLAGQTLTLDRPSSNIIDLLIDQGQYFATILDDVMEIQSDINQLNIWSDDAAEQLKITIDTAVLAAVPAGVAAANKGATAGRKDGKINLGVTGTPLSVTKATVLENIIDLGQVLDEQNIPETGRWLIIPAWMASHIKKSDLKQVMITGDQISPLRNGKIGMLDRFTVYISNLLPTATDGANTAYYAFAGHKHGLTFASQLERTETLRSESTFGTVMRGLKIYGFKVVDGTAIAQLYAIKG